MLRIQVLGALHASLEANGSLEVPDLGGPRQRSVLALLLVARGQVVSVDRLVEDLWNGEPPPRAIGALQAYVSHLRRALEPSRAPRSPASVLVSEPPGYAVRVPVEAVDGWRFESLVRQAGDDTDAARARELLQTALDLWRGRAYGEFAAEPWAEAEAARLEGLRIVAREHWCEAVLRMGDAHEAVSAAELLTREHPLREEGWRLLAMGLYAGGRQADALTALRRARDILAEELGLDPGPALLQVESDVLAQRLALPAARIATAKSRSGSQRSAPTEPLTTPAAARTGTGPDRTAAATAKTEDASEFVGRESELNALHSLATEARGRGDRRVALVAGEAGAGKSRLLTRFTRELGQNGWRVVIGRCPESAGAPPAWAWVEALRSLVREVDPGPLSPALAPLLDENRTTAGESDASFGRFLLSRAVTSYLTAAARTSPLAVLLDDLHRGDSETLALLDSVASEASGIPLLIIAAYRPAEVQPGLRDALAGLAALPPSRIALDGLDSAQAARLIRSVAGVQPDPVTLDALVERTAGNPFYLTESARLLGSEGGLVATSKVPEGVRDVLRRRFARLPEITVSVLRLAAVIGRDVDIDVLIQAAEVDEETVLDALEAGILAGLLTEPTAGSVRFGHVLVRDTLYEDAPRLRRGRWHARVADAVLAVHPADAAALAHHYHQAATTATARRAVDAGTRAAEQAVARYAHDTAVELYSAALADLDRVPDADELGAAELGTADLKTNDRGHDAPHSHSATRTTAARTPAGLDAPAGPPAHLAERVELLARLSLSQLAAGASLAALGSRARALELADRANRVDLLVRALTAWDLPTPWLTRSYGVVDSVVVARIERVLAADHPAVQDPAVRCRLLCALVAEISGELTDRADQAAQEALRIARGLADPLLTGFALHAMCSVVMPDLDPAHRAEIGRELLDIGERPGLAVFALLGHHVMVQVHGPRGDHASMQQHVELLDALVRKYRWRQAQSIVTMHRGLIAHLRGELDRADALYTEAAALMYASGAVDAAGIITLAFLTVRLTQGRAGELEQQAGNAASAATDVMAELLALVVARQGQVARAREIRGRVAPVRRDFFHSLMLTMRGMLVVDLADPAEAGTVYADLLAYRGQIGGAGTGSYAAGPVDTVLGDLALLLGDRQRAVEHYRIALALAEHCGNAAWAAQARERLAGLLT